MMIEEVLIYCLLKYYIEVGNFYEYLFIYDDRWRFFRLSGREFYR
jgi:hypothetical protein